MMDHMQMLELGRIKKQKRERQRAGRVSGRPANSYRCMVAAGTWQREPGRQ